MSFSSGRVLSCLSTGTDAWHEKSLEYAIQATASVWMPFEQVHKVVSGNVDFNSFGMAPWDAGGMHGDRCQLHQAIQTMMLQWLMRLLCRPVIVHGLDRNMTMNTENGLDTIMMITTDSPRLTATPGESYTSDGTTQIRCDLRHTHVISAEVDCNTVEPSDMIFLRLSLPPENVSAGYDENDGSPKIDCAAVELNDLTFRRLRLPPGNVSVGHDGNYGSPKIDSATVELNDLIFRQLRFPPEDFAAAWDIAATAGGAAKLDYMIFRRTSFPPNELSGGRDGDYIWLRSGNDLSVCARPVTGSLCFGHPHGLLSPHCLESVTLMQNYHCQSTVVRITPDICYLHHTWCIEGYVIRSSITVILTVWYRVGVQNPSHGVRGLV